MATLTEQVAALTALVGTLVAAQAAPAQASTSFATKGNGVTFPCKATDGLACSRSLRTLKRSLTHGIEAGHEARA